MHRKRVIVAFLLGPLLCAYVLFLPGYFFLILLAAASSVALAEFYSMTEVGGGLKYTGLVLSAALLALDYYLPSYFSEGILLCVLAFLTVRLFMTRDPSRSVAQVSASVLGMVYIPGMLAFQFGLVRHNPAFIVMLYIAVWFSDSAAYYVGKGLGKKKLYVEVSPNKTVAGAYGSVLGGILGALLVRFVLIAALPLEQTVLIGACIGTSTIVGDLAESMLKRDAGIKDSGTLLPGHGGLLDKIDGVTFAGPVMYWLCRGLGLIN